MRLVAGVVLFLALAAASALAAVREVSLVVDSNVTGGGVVGFPVDRDLLGVFRGLYVSNASDCRVPLNTSWWTGGVWVSVYFQPGVNLTAGEYRFYLCYGDIYYEDRCLCNTTFNGDVVVSVESPEETVTGYPRVVLADGDSYSVALGRVYVEDASWVVYCYTSSCSVQVTGDGEAVASETLGRGWSTVSAGGFEVQDSVGLYVVSGLVYLYSYTVTYREYVVNSTSVDGGSGDRFRVETDASWFNVSLSGGWVYVGGGIYETSAGTSGQVGGPPYLVYVDRWNGYLVDGGGGYVVLPFRAVDGDNLTVTFYIGGYSASATYSLSVQAANTTEAEVVYVSEPLAAAVAGEGEGNGSTTVVVNVEGGGGVEGFYVASAVAALLFTGFMASRMVYDLVYTLPAVVGLVAWYMAALQAWGWRVAYAGLLVMGLLVFAVMVYRFLRVVATG